jgi:hypothetical protein
MANIPPQNALFLLLMESFLGLLKRLQIRVLIIPVPSAAVMGGVGLSYKRSPCVIVAICKYFFSFLTFEDYHEITSSGIKSKS